jgi:hypothetical protein
VADLEAILECLDFVECVLGKWLIMAYYLVLEKLVGKEVIYYDD